MPKKKVRSSVQVQPVRISAVEILGNEPDRAPLIGWVRSHLIAVGAASLGLLITLGVFAQSGWLPHTDPLSGKRTGWFGRDLPKNAPSSWNPFAPPDPTPTPALTKEYVYAGSRLVAVEDKNASAIPPEDLAVWRPSDGTWRILGSQQTPPQFGQSTDKPVQGDFDGDGRTDFAVFRPGDDAEWWILKSSDGSSYGVSFGTSGVVAVPADYDGDSKTDIAYWHPSSPFAFNIIPSTTGTPYSVTYGTTDDVPAPADYDGDGRADVAVWRGSDHKFYSKNSSNGQAVEVSFGSSSGTPVCGDYDGDGKANYALKSGNSWIIMNAALTSTTTTNWQSSGGEPVPNDYDGDGIVDIAVWKAAEGMGLGSNYYWYIRQSADNFSTRTVQWGVSTDYPVPAYYRR